MEPKGGEIVSAVSHTTPTMALVSQSLTSWKKDSGATDHMTGNKDFFFSLTYSDALPTVMIADGSTTRTTGIGEVQLTDSIRIHRILYIPFFSTESYFSQST